MYGAFATAIGLTTNCLRHCEYDLENPQFLQISRSILLLNTQAQMLIRNI